MNYYIDTEFIEGTQKKRILGISTGFHTKPTIDLISIGIVSEDNREYYAISKDFNIDEAWYRYDLKDIKPPGHVMHHVKEKVYWIRENVLKPIFNELANKYFNDFGFPEHYFNLKDFKELIHMYGKSNKKIAQEIKEFVGFPHYQTERLDTEDRQSIEDKPEFYGYYTSYDWVVFCWIFGKIIALPKGFPMFPIDLKVELDRMVLKLGLNKVQFKFDEDYPKQTDEHNAIADARWNKKLDEYISKKYTEHILEQVITKTNKK